MKAIRGKTESESRHVRAYRFFRIFKVRSVSKRTLKDKTHNAKEEIRVMRV